MKVFSDKQINSIKRDLQIWLGEEYAKSFDRSKDKVKWFLVNQDDLLTNDQFVKKYDIDALASVDTKPMESLYKRYPNFSKLTDNQIKRFTNSTDISKEELKKYYDFETERKKSIDKFNETRYKEIDKQRQEAERAEGGYYNSPIANEYARKHYIQGHPIQARINEVAGKVAAGADFLPFPLAYGGSAIRTMQKWAADEPVMTPGTLADFGGSSLGLLNKIPGVREGVRGITGKIANALTRGNSQTNREIARVVNEKALQETAEQAAKELKIITKDLDKLSDADLIKLAGESSNPMVKSSINDILKSRNEWKLASEVAGNPKVAGTNEAAEAAAAKVEQAEQAMDEAVNEATKKFAGVQPELEVKSNRAKDIFGYEGESDMLQPVYKDVNVQDLYDYTLRNTKPSFMSRAIGEGILGAGRKISSNQIAHRRWDEINYDPKYNEDKAINEVIRLYSDDWKYGKPSNYNEPLIKAAYDKWLAEQYNKGNYDVLYRMGEI